MAFIHFFLLFCDRFEKLRAEFVSVELERTEAVRQLGAQSESLTSTFKVCLFVCVC